ncbi:CHRD domain-containing protein [Winogradskyella forsetii]|uniref:CHRD domain-containing protein n=1 Tax=Winogradskyella forsetii TaxID=2686077 RepID=UPI0015BB8533|nr:CHRD domain-containing protein [Winogradskyella forsetii]
MTKTFKLVLMLFISVALVNCSDDDDLGLLIGPTGESKIYTLGSVADPSISGTATFIENTDNSVTIELDLNGTPDGGMHPAHIHFNTAAEGGDIALTLGTVDGNTGFSSITTNTLNGGSVISYEQLLDYDGYINVHLSADDLGTLVAQGDIGQNELTDDSVTYPLATVDVAGISGTAEFTKRVNGEALATLSLVGTPDGGMHPAHIHAGSVATAPGGIIFTFNPVDGTSGMSKTNVSMLDDESAFNYDDVLSVDGYINVHLSANELGTLVAQGNAGSNI